MYKCRNYESIYSNTPALTISPVTFYAYPASCAIAGKYKGTKKTSKGILHSALAFMHLAFRAWRRKKVRHPLGGHLSMNRELCP